ncbi:MAG: UGSC family (seleno)protein, partial [Pseudomonadota bacterium]
MVVCSTAFVTLGRTQLKALGAPDTPIAVIPHPFGLRTRDEVRTLAEQCVEEIARLALGGADPTQRGVSAHAPSSRARQIEAPDDIEAFNELCESRQWSDGLPLIPPTQERVQRMLRETRHSPQHIVAHVAPGFGAATLEAIAINAVMAGCKPEYLSVLIAAVDAVTDRAFNLQGIQATTNPATPWIIVNGPINAALGVNGGLNCMGQGTRANATIGRALRLILQNI